ncbi:MAG: signal peptidase II [Kiritimatiellae bacterium]|nr:signal peptidase II [Kiritimatiellia bacterium]
MLALWIAVLTVVADQASKEYVREVFDLHESLPFIPGFIHWVYIRNPGAAWGMMGGMNGILVIFSLVMLGLMLAFRKSFLSDTTAHRVALGLMCGGIVGNLMDRVRMGYVTDFIDVFVGTHHWPAFNIADSAICIGVGIYLFTTARAEKRSGREPEASAPQPGRPAE